MPTDRAFHRTPPASQTLRSWPHFGQISIHSRDSASMASAQRLGIKKVKNL
ncbi:MAG: hypothetical protein JXR96_03495 [Deltaproteobacteria bacterium]|nr:hypothetical protein [Deltaproteobacteria bacterium]